MTTAPLVARRFIPIVALLSVTVLAACGTNSEPTDAAPSGDTAALTCGGQGVDDSADIRYRTETVIDAPLSAVWDMHTDVENWPAWQQPVTSLALLDSGPLAEASRFRWTTPAHATPTTPATTLVITSTVEDLEPQSCIRWSGPAVGEGLTIDNGVHVWNFSEVDGGVLVRTEETWTGAQVKADVPTSTTFLGAGLQAWLNDYKTAAEARF